MNAAACIAALGLDRIASRILDRAEDCATWMPGASKVFLSDLAETGICTLLNVDLEGLKQLALACHAAGKLVLSRADMVELMDPAKVRASEIRDYGTFHFLNVA